MDYCSADKKEILPFLATWMDPEYIISEKVRWRKTANHCHLISLICGKKTPKKPIEKDNR